MGNNLHIHLKFKLKKEDIDGFSVDANEFLENTKAYIDSILGAADASHGFTSIGTVELKDTQGGVVSSSTRYSDRLDFRGVAQDVE